MKNNVRFAVLSFLIFFIASSIAVASEDWTFVKEDDGILNYKRDVENSKYSSYKAVAVVDSDMAQVGAVFRDILAYPQWMANVSEAKILKKYNANDMDIYFVINFPWPTSDRDMVVQARTTVDKDTGIVTIMTEDYMDPAVPEKDGLVRVPQLVQIFTMKYMDVKKTEVAYSLHMEAGGSLPVSAVEMDLKKAPYKSLKKLMDFVHEEPYANADTLDPVNIDITKTIVRLNLKHYVANEEFIEEVLNNKEVMKQLIKNGHKPENHKKNAELIARCFIGSPKFVTRIGKSKEKDVLSQLKTNGELLNEMMEDDDFVKIILETDQDGMNEELAKDVAGMIKKHLNG